MDKFNLTSGEAQLARNVIKLSVYRNSAWLMDLYACAMRHVAGIEDPGKRAAIAKTITGVWDVIRLRKNGENVPTDANEHFNIEMACGLMATYLLTGKISAAYAVCALPRSPRNYLYACEQLASDGNVAPGLKASDLEAQLIKEQPGFHRNVWEFDKATMPAFHAPVRVNTLLELSRNLGWENVPPKIVDPKTTATAIQVITDTMFHT